MKTRTTFAQSAVCQTTSPISIRPKTRTTSNTAMVSTFPRHQPLHHQALHLPQLTLQSSERPTSYSPPLIQIPSTRTPTVLHRPRSRQCTSRHHHHPRPSTLPNLLHSSPTSTEPRSNILRHSMLGQPLRDENGSARRMLGLRTRRGERISGVERR